MAKYTDQYRGPVKPNESDLALAQYSSQRDPVETFQDSPVEREFSPVIEERYELPNIQRNVERNS